MTSTLAVQSTEDDQGTGPLGTDPTTDDVRTELVETIERLADKVDTLDPSILAGWGVRPGMAPLASRWLRQSPEKVADWLLSTFGPEAAKEAVEDIEKQGDGDTSERAGTSPTPSAKTPTPGGTPKVTATKGT